MSSADRPGPIGASAAWLRTQPRRYGFAFLAVCPAVSLQRGLEFEAGFPHSFLLFYLTIFIVALLAGFWLGVVSTLLSALAADYFYSFPRSSRTFSDETESVGLALFVLTGIGDQLGGRLGPATHQSTSRIRESGRRSGSVRELEIHD